MEGVCAVKVPQEEKAGIKISKVETWDEEMELCEMRELEMVERN